MIQLFLTVGLEAQCMLNSDLHGLKKYVRFG